MEHDGEWLHISVSQNGRGRTYIYSPKEEFRAIILRENRRDAPHGLVRVTDNVVDFSVVSMRPAGEDLASKETQLTGIHVSVERTFREFRKEWDTTIVLRHDVSTGSNVFRKAVQEGLGRSSVL